MGDVLRRMSSLAALRSLSFAKAHSLAAAAHQKILRALITCCTVCLSLVAVLVILYTITGKLPAGIGSATSSCRWAPPCL